MSLCKLHHAAFDGNLVGVRPDLVIEVAERVLEEEDGPMLRHGLQGLHGQTLHVPRRPQDRPAITALEHRYAQFRATG
jgi:putative restriction endonuclease